MSGKRSKLLRKAEPKKPPRPRLFQAGLSPRPVDELERQLEHHGSGMTREQLDQCFVHGEFVGNPDVEMERILTDAEEGHLLEMGEAALHDPEKFQKMAEKAISDLVEDFIYIDTKPFRFKTEYLNRVDGSTTTHDRGYLKPLYDLCLKYPKGCRNQVWHTGRQVEKSTTQSAKAITLGAVFPAYKSLYIAPRFDQVSVFSNQRFKPMAEDSPEMQARIIRPSKHLWQVGQKEFLNRSFFNFRSCYATADGSRGISAHHLMIDELQDIISDNIPVLEECQSHYGWETGLRFRSYAGTPKTNNNPLSRRYRKSAQFEWMTPCTHCNHWNFPDEKIIGLTCYICTRCGQEIHPQAHGQWIPMNPSALEDCWGFRLPQMVVPFKTHADIKEKMDDPNISQLKFFNECLGLPYDEGEIVLHDRHMQRACTQVAMKTPAQMLMMASKGTPMFAGLDHGTGEGDNPSFTVLTIGSFDQNFVFHIHYMRKFEGKEAALNPQMGIVNQICNDSGVRWLMADWGFGAHQNARLVDEYGWDWVEGQRVLLQAMYVKQRRMVTFDSQGFKYLIDRNQSMQRCIDAVKSQQIRFFRWEEMKKFSNDFTTIYVEYNDTYGTMKYDHVDPDDAFHSANYAYMAGLQFHGRLAPTGAPNLDEVDPEDLGY